MPVKFRLQALPSAGICHVYCAEEPLEGEWDRLWPGFLSRCRPSLAACIDHSGAEHASDKANRPRVAAGDRIIIMTVSHYRSTVTVLKLAD